MGPRTKSKFGAPINFGMIYW